MKEIVLAIVGSRTFTNYALLRQVCDNINSKVIMVVSGGAQGADLLGARWARENDIKLKEYLPNWKAFGKSAGYRRNADIIRAADAVIAFWDGQSRGTKHSIDLAETKDIPVHIVYYERT